MRSSHGESSGNCAENVLKVGTIFWQLPAAPGPTPPAAASHCAIPGWRCAYSGGSSRHRRARPTRGPWPPARRQVRQPDRRSKPADTARPSAVRKSARYFGIRESDARITICHAGGSDCRNRLLFRACGRFRPRAAAPCSPHSPLPTSDLWKTGQNCPRVKCKQLSAPHSWLAGIRCMA